MKAAWVNSGWSQSSGPQTSGRVTHSLPEPSPFGDPIWGWLSLRGLPGKPSLLSQRGYVTAATGARTGRTKRGRSEQRNRVEAELLENFWESKRGVQRWQPVPGLCRDVVGEPSGGQCREGPRAACGDEGNGSIHNNNICNQKSLLSTS